MYIYFDLPLIAKKKKKSCYKVLRSLRKLRRNGVVYNDMYDSEIFSQR